ncbi:hypothetical protein [Hyphomonas oceanitis]|uniref:hypothetical protein n=1 Tax=Hyphomonas oceanitis TaxID=81033 RepID=UPI003002396B
MIHVFSERMFTGMGWDGDKSGHYVPPPLPKWIWITAALAFFGFLALVVFFPG